MILLLIKQAFTCIVETLYNTLYKVNLTYVNETTKLLSRIVIGNRNDSWTHTDGSPLVNIILLYEVGFTVKSSDVNPRHLHISKTSSTTKIIMFHMRSNSSCHKLHILSTVLETRAWISISMKLPQNQSSLMQVTTYNVPQSSKAFLIKWLVADKDHSLIMAYFFPKQHTSMYVRRIKSYDVCNSQQTTSTLLNMAKCM